MKKLDRRSKKLARRHSLLMARVHKVEMEQQKVANKKHKLWMKKQTKKNKSEVVAPVAPKEEIIEGLPDDALEAEVEKAD